MLSSVVLKKDYYSSASDGAYIVDKGDTDAKQAFYSTVWAVL